MTKSFGTGRYLVVAQRFGKQSGRFHVDSESIDVGCELFKDGRTVESVSFGAVLMRPVYRFVRCLTNCEWLHRRL